MPSKNPNEKLSSSDVSNELQTKSSSLQQLDLNSLVSVDKSGDASLSVPILNVRGRTLNLPISVSYKAGIKVDQHASEVGLGWNINFGSIVRDFGMFEPDYTATSAETEMKNTSNPSLGAGTLTTGTSPGYELPSSNNKNLIYNAINTGNLTPDDYHVSIPGIGGSSFWNNGGLNQPHNFVFTGANPWNLNFSKKTFEIHQEFSRINELTYQKSGSTNYLVNQGRNLAAAICVPPYALNRSFNRFVGKTYDPGVNSPAIVSSQYNFPYNEKVKYEDFNSFTITVEDGTVYVFGRALRGQKYLFTEDPFWSTIPESVHSLGSSLPGNAIYGEWWKIDYIAEWLLTEVRSYDYFDANENGVADDGDTGDWIRIEYTQPYQTEKIPGMLYTLVPKHREWLNYTQTDKASSLMRERAYVTKIVTPVQQIDFAISKRFDIDQDYFKTPLNWVNSVNQGVDYVYANAYAGNYDKLEVNYPVETMKYDQVTIKERLNDQILNTVRFNYAAKGSAEELAVSDYIIRSNNDQETIPYDPANTAQLLNIEKYNTKASGNPYQIGRGKTTLISIDFFPQANLTSSEKRSYKFEYAYNPSLSAIHKHEIEYWGSYPRLRQSLVMHQRPKDWNLVLSPYKYWSYEVDINGNANSFGTSSTALIDEMGNYLDVNAPNKGRHAWSLSKLTLPTGGSVALEYENDQFDITADRAGWLVAGSIQDDRMPHIANYNKIAIARSYRQSQITGGYNGIYKKLLPRTFSMPMNSETGGIRLKKKTINDGINPLVVTNYTYGTGHYSSVPASYWTSYLAAFGYFMSSEQLRHSSERLSYIPQLQQDPTFWEYDFATYMSELSFNIRLDNVITDNHYYTYVDQISADNSKTRYHYGDPSAVNSALYYDVQKPVYLKGYERRDLIMGLTANKDVAHEIKLLKTENFSGSFGNFVSSKEWKYGFDVIANKQVNYQSVSLPVRTYPIYANDAGFSYKLATYVNPSAFDLFTSGMLITIDPLNPAAAINEVISLAASKQYANVKDNGYSISSGTYVNHQSVRTKLNSEVSNYKGVIKTTEYTYESHGLVKTVLDKNSTKTRQFPDLSLETIEEDKVTLFKYAFESYNDPVNVFLQRNMLNQKSGVNTYFRAVNNYSILTSNVQTWITSGAPRPDKFYEYRGNIDDYDGQMVNYSNFNYVPNAVLSPNWQLRNSSLEFNKLGQRVLEKTNDIHTRNIMGYNSEIPKATIRYTGGWFDATYTGFEDMDFISKDMFTCYVLEKGGVSCGGNIKYYVDNSSNMFALGDVVSIIPNALTNDCAPSGATFNISPLTATVSDIFLESAYPGAASVSSCLGMSGDFSNYKTVLCFKDPLPYNVSLSGAKISVRSKAKVPILNPQLPEFWYNTNSNTASKVVTRSKTTPVRTGTKSFYLATNTTGSPPYQSTPIRPIYIEPASCSPGPCTIIYKASFWVRNDLTGLAGGPPPVGSTVLHFTYSLNNINHSVQGTSNSLFVNGITNEWKYIEMEIPVTKTAQPQLLDVFVENVSVNNVEGIFIDDIIVYPKGAKYEYNSYDKFLNVVHHTDVNDRTFSTTYDTWGRPALSFDANGNMVSDMSYFTTTNISAFHNYVEVTNWIDGNTYQQTRQFFDGTGKPKESCIYDPGLNRRLISVIDYDNQGRPIKLYNPYGETGN